MAAVLEQPTGTVLLTSSGELTILEQEERDYLEKLVERAFYSAGKALQTLRDKKLYRSTHNSFESYCLDRFNYNSSRSYQLMDAADVVDNLKKVPQIVELLPTAEGQVRPLVKLDFDTRREAWKMAVEEVNGKVPSGRVVKDIVNRIRERTKLPNPHRVGEVCMILPKDNPDLRGKSGSWCVIVGVGDFSCTVETWDGEYTVKIEHLKSLEYTDTDCQFMQQLLARLRRLYQVANRDAATDWLLLGFGKQPQAWLTLVQESLLVTLEQTYGL
jgi:hypothetical protein